jgi:hypothetical protein
VFEKLRQHAAIIAAIILIWLTHSDLTAADGEKKAKAKTKLAGITAGYLEQRDPDVPLDWVRDPIGIIRADTPPKADSKQPDRGAAASKSATDVVASSPAVTYSPDDVAQAWSQAASQLATDAVRGLKGWDPFGFKARAAKAGAEPELPQAHFSLVLDATLGQGNGGTARISGRSVAVGEVIPGMDPDTPPVLKRVEGSSVVILYRGELLFLDLDHNARINIGGPPARAEVSEPERDSKSSGTRASSGSKAPSGPPLSPGLLKRRRKKGS